MNRSPHRTQPSNGGRTGTTSVGLAFVVWMCGAMVIASAQEPVAAVTLPNEYTVKAVFLYSFGRYTTWPQGTFRDPQQPFVIGIIGSDSIGGALDDIASKKSLQDRRIVVRRFASSEEVQSPCHILFVSSSVSSDVQAALITKAHELDSLVVGESPGFVEAGGDVNFFIEGDRVRFEINVDIARQSRLRMDAKLLNLGKPVGVQRTTAATNRSE